LRFIADLDLVLRRQVALARLALIGRTPPVAAAIAPSQKRAEKDEEQNPAKHWMDELSSALHYGAPDVQPHRCTHSTVKLRPTGTGKAGI
jgi:hypothetical protein